MARPSPAAFLLGFGVRVCSCTVAAAALLTAGVPPGGAGVREDWKRGKLLYTERCLFCHGREGRGWNLQSRVARPPVPVPDLTDSSFMRGFSDKQLFQVIKKGGTRAGKSRFMPPAGRWLSDKDIHDVIIYIRSLERPPANEKK